MGTNCLLIFTTWNFTTYINKVKALRSPAIMKPSIVPLTRFPDISHQDLFAVVIKYLLRWNTFGKSTYRHLKLIRSSASNTSKVKSSLK